MAIPVIQPYRMPVEDELPGNTASWRTDPRRAVLLIHDMQRYFLNFFPAGEQPLVDLIANIGLLRVTAAALGIPVVYTAQSGGMSRVQRGLLHEIWGPGMARDPECTDIAEEIAPTRHDTVLPKWRYSAFFHTDLAEFMADRGRDQLVVCGVYAHVGCLVTACDAFMHDIEPFVVADAVADFSRAEHRMALRYAAERCAVTRTTRRLVDELAYAMRHPVPVAMRPRSLCPHGGR
jgi:bifunctional isochorismate lyase/aryl carrier protein